MRRLLLAVLMLTAACSEQDGKDSADDRSSCEQMYDCFVADCLDDLDAFHEACDQDDTSEACIAAAAMSSSCFSSCIGMEDRKWEENTPPYDAKLTLKECLDGSPLACEQAEVTCAESNW